MSGYIWLKLKENLVSFLASDTLPPKPKVAGSNPASFTSKNSHLASFLLSGFFVFATLLLPCRVFATRRRVAKKSRVAKNPSSRGNPPLPQFLPFKVILTALTRQSAGKEKSGSMTSSPDGLTLRRSCPRIAMVPSKAEGWRVIFWELRFSRR